MAITANVFWDSTASVTRLAYQPIKQTGVGLSCQAYQLENYRGLVLVYEKPPAAYRDAMLVKKLGTLGE